MSSNFPCSNSISAATTVTGLVSDAIRNTESSCIGLCELRSAYPNASKNASLPARITSATAPGMTSASASARSAASNLFSLVGEKPAASGSGAALKADVNDRVLDMRYERAAAAEKAQGENIVPRRHTL